MPFLASRNSLDMLQIVTIITPQLPLSSARTVQTHKIPSLPAITDTAQLFDNNFLFEEQKHHQCPETIIVPPRTQSVTSNKLPNSA
jgi:hypothetical protein